MNILSDPTFPRNKVMSRSAPDFVIIAGSSHPDLVSSNDSSSDFRLNCTFICSQAQKIASRLDVPLGNCSVYHTSNKETLVDIGESVRGRDVYIVQTGLYCNYVHSSINMADFVLFPRHTGSKDVNNSIMELLIMAYTCKTSSAKNIVGVLPYLPYSKQSKMRKRGCIASKLLAKMLVKSGLTQVITVDLHQKEVQGFFDVPVDNLRASPFLLQYIQESIPNYKNGVIVARDPGAAHKVTSYAERLRLSIAVLHGEEKAVDDEVDGRCSPPVMSTHSRTVDLRLGTLPPLAAKEKPPISLVGDVRDKIAIMVDDMVDDVASFVAAANTLKEHGAQKIYLLATHGLLSKDAPRLIEDSPIDEVVVTNTVPHEIQKMVCHKIKTIDISILLAESIRRIHNNESMSYLFRNVGLED